MTSLPPPPETPSDTAGDGYRLSRRPPPPGRVWCGATSKRRAAPCSNWAIPGGKVCDDHGGRAPHVKAAAERNVAQAAAAQAVVTYGLPVDVTPIEALLEEIRHTAGHVEWLRARIREIDEEALTLGVAEQKIDPDGGKTVTIRTAPNVWLDLYDRERRHLVAVCSAALRAGVEERQVRLAERQGVLLAEVIRAVLADLHLTPDQLQLVPEIVPRHLRAIGGPA